MANLVLLLLVMYAGVCSANTRVDVDVGSPPLGGLEHFWTSTGLSPPLPHEEAYKFLLSNDEYFNLALISSTPREAVVQVRIHWLLDLITVSDPGSSGPPQFNFTWLDVLLDRLHYHGLMPGFELMGNPSSYFSDFTNDTQVKHWQQLVSETASRYISRYGEEHVTKWRFETWNEPDLRGYNDFNFTLQSFLRYVDGCSAGLGEASRRSGLRGRRLRLGGPAGLFKAPDKHPLCWGVMESCAKKSHPDECPLDFISFHKKGGGTGSAVLKQDLQLAQDFASRFPTLQGIPLANDEADPLTGWSHSEPWRADATYGALVARVIFDHQKEFVRKHGHAIEVLSNDNAFLNYHPYYFTQRTLLTRFQINNTNPPHLQFFRKPVFTVMTLLSLLGSQELKTTVTGGDDRVSVLAASSGSASVGWEAAVCLAFTNETAVDPTEVQHVTINIHSLPSSGGCCRYTVYRVDNLRTNPDAVWRRLGASVFPTRNARRLIRAAEGPERLINIQEVQSPGQLSVEVSLSLPSVAMLHICSRTPHLPGPIEWLEAYNVTSNEVLLIWKIERPDSVCLKTFEVEFSPKTRGKSKKNPKFKRINTEDVIYLSYQYVAPIRGSNSAQAQLEDQAAGVYRVRAVDYWDRQGPYSEEVVYPLPT